MKIEQLQERIIGASGLIIAGTLLLIFGLSGTMAGPEDSILMIGIGASFLLLSLVVFLFCYQEDPKDSWRDAVREQKEEGVS
ncbi:MAG: hypothetical protein GF411_20215 [Candidatus Lokiarchaeota archaeon]|nr:hypothetical protein [Candidatus Lokiarchaeota archaeon]